MTKPIVAHTTRSRVLAATPQAVIKAKPNSENGKKTVDSTAGIVASTAQEASTNVAERKTM